MEQLRPRERLMSAAYLAATVILSLIVLVITAIEMAVVAPAYLGQRTYELLRYRRAR